MSLILKMLSENTVMPETHFSYCWKICKVQDVLPFLLINECGGNGNSFPWSSAFIKEAHTVEENIG